MGGKDCTNNKCVGGAGGGAAGGGAAGGGAAGGGAAGGGAAGGSAAGGGAAGGGAAGGGAAGGGPSDGGAADAGAVATLADFWVGKARWQLMTPAGLPLAASGQHMIVIPDGTPNGRWYHFSGGGSRGGPGCGDGWGIVVQRATGFDSNGVPTAWSAGATVVAPTVGTWWECMATDGRAFYNPVDNKFHLLFQCLNTMGIWRGCHVERNGNDPMAGPIDPSTGGWKATGGEGATGLIIDSAGLFSRFCDAGTRCYGMREEGTFDIFDYDAVSGYSIGFHGFNGDGSSSGSLVRAWAQLKDFSEFCTPGAPGGCTSGWNFPADSFLDAQTQCTPGTMDANETWSHCAAGGSGDIFKEGNTFYYIGEVGDYWCPFMSPVCALPSAGGGRASRWDLVMAKASGPRPTSWSWNTLATGNPVFLSPIYPDGGLPPWIFSGYPDLFSRPSDGTIWLSVVQSIETTILPFLYKLVPTDNRLVNGAFATGTTSGWSVTRSGISIAAIREPWNASDGNSYLRATCNGACQTLDSVYQEIPASTLVGRLVSFGGKVKATGAPVIGVSAFELSTMGAVTPRPFGNVTATGTWQSFSSSFTARSDTATIRLEVYLYGTGEVDLDQMFVSGLSAGAER